MSTARLGLFSAILGGVTAVPGAFPVASLIAFVYRFPVPLDGMRSGPGEVGPSLFAAAIYGLLGGFLLVGVLGVLSGSTFSRTLSDHPDVKVEAEQQDSRN